MKQTELNDLTRIVEDLSRTTTIGQPVRRVEVEPSDDGLGGTFLRVSLHVEHPEQLTWDLVKPLVTSIEDRLLDVDDRFPSVHFPDPDE
jgi:hypothetical protein